MSRLIVTLALVLCSVPLLAQDSVCYFQKCYGSGTVLMTNTPQTPGTIEVAVRNILCPEGATPSEDPLAGKLVFRTVTPALASWIPIVPVLVVMHDADAYAMDRPFAATFSGPATAYIGFKRQGIKGTLKATIVDWRDPTDALGPGIMLFDTVEMTFVPENSPLPYPLEWRGIVWKGDLIVFERWGR